MEEEYQDELAKEKDIDTSVLGAEELDDEEVGGCEGKLGGDIADDHPGSPASVGQYICQRGTKELQLLIDAQMFEVISEEQ